MSLTSPRWCVCVPRVYVCLCVCVAGAVGPSPMDEEVFNTADEQCTPQIGRTPLKFRPPEQRAPSLAPQGSSVSRPDYDDFLRRCAVVLYQHIVRSHKALDAGQPLRASSMLVPQAAMAAKVAPGQRVRRRHHLSAGDSDTNSDDEDEGTNMADLFHESLFVKPRWRYVGGGVCPVLLYATHAGSPSWLQIHFRARTARHGRIVVQNGESGAQVPYPDRERDLQVRAPPVHQGTTICGMQYRVPGVRGTVDEEGRPVASQHQLAAGAAVRTVAGIQGVLPRGRVPCDLSHGR